MKKILFPTDFSENAVHASKYASMLTRTFGANIVLLNVYSQPTFSEYPRPFPQASFDISLKNMAERNLEDFTITFAKNSHLAAERITQMVEFGDAATGILETAKMIHADFIVMGTKGAANMLDRWLGTTAQKVMEDAPCPVWIIPQEACLDYPSKIMYAADFKENETEAMRKVLAFSEPMGANCKVVHIKDYFESEIVEDVQKTIGDLKAEFIHEDVSFKELNRHNVVDALEKHILNYKPDVLILAKHKKSIFGTIFDTSITKHFVQEGRLPMLIFEK
jgi:nucleotide-binding universal stress UspA family protein